MKRAILLGVMAFGCGGPKPAPNDYTPFALCVDACKKAMACDRTPGPELFSFDGRGPAFGALDLCHPSCSTVFGAIRQEIGEAFFDCYLAEMQPTCEEDDQTCTSVARQEATPRPIDTSLPEACTRKESACAMTNTSLYCTQSFTRFFTEEYLMPIAACYDRPCDAVKSCIMAIDVIPR
jgi:hypothetical protein